MLETQIATFLPIASQLREEPEPQSYSFASYQLGELLKLKEMAKFFDLKPVVLNPTRIVYELSKEGYLILFNFGSVVFFNISEEVQKTTLERLQKNLPKSESPVMNDTFILEAEKKAKNQVFFDKVTVDKLSREKIEMISMVLAQSSALEYFENKVETIFARLQAITGELEQTGKTKIGEKKALQFMGTAMTTKQNLLATLCLLEKPDETWDDKVLDDLYQEATMMFEIKERFRTLDYKLKTIQENLELLSNSITNRWQLILEGTIVALIMLEVALFFYELFWKN